jgi:monofunctional biosynthetic peptidoglycan transglycosylase
VALLATVVPVLALRWVRPLTSAFMLQHRIERLVAGEPQRLQHAWVPFEAISPQVAIAVIAAEDQKFPLHHGFDLASIADAIEQAETGRVRGASTISQQVAKNLFLWPGRSLLRKGLEAWLTLWIEALWPKRRILEVYLNVAQFGEGVFGVGAASRVFFRRPAAELDAWQGALLAAVLPSPERLHAERPSSYVQERARRILEHAGRLGGVGYLATLRD